MDKCLKYIGISSASESTLLTGGRYSIGDIKTEDFEIIFQGLTKGEARGVEQKLIELNNQGEPYPYKSKTIDNFINSTSPKRVIIYSGRNYKGKDLLDKKFPSWNKVYNPLDKNNRLKRGFLFNGLEYNLETNCCQ